MAHGRMVFIMNAPCEAVFDAFHHEQLRSRWDSLVKHPRLESGGQWPYAGAITFNPGSGWTAGLSMRTQFVSFQRPKLAAARMLGQSFPFRHWAASIKHEPIDQTRSHLIYTYNLKASWWLWGWASWAVHLIFRHETRRRFKRMGNFLDARLPEVLEWQRLSGLCERAGTASKATSATLVRPQ